MTVRSCSCRLSPTHGGNYYPWRELTRPALDPHRRRQDRDPHPHHEAGRGIQPWFDNARRLRDLIAELEARSLRAFNDAEA